MRPRDAVILYQKTEGDTDVETQDINIVDLISAFYIEVHCTNGATSNEDNFISDIVTKIEVVDGGKTLVSLNMAQLEALNFYKTGHIPVLFPSEWGGGQQRHGAYLLFGRYLWDQERAFDPTKYKNPQIKVTFNKAAIRAAGATGYADADNIVLTLVAKVMQGVASPGRFFAAKEIDSFTSAASGDERVNLPTDYPYSLLMLRAWLEGYDIDEIVSDLKITCETDDYIPLERKVKQLDAEALATFGVCELKHDIKRGGSFTARLLCNKEPWFTGFVKTPGTPRVLVPWAQWSSNYNAELYNMDGTLDGTARDITGWERGHALHATLPVIFGRPYVIEDFFPAQTYKKLEAVLTQATASAAVEVVIEQDRPY